MDDVLVIVSNARRFYTGSLPCIGYISSNWYIACTVSNLKTVHNIMGRTGGMVLIIKFISKYRHFFHKKTLYLSSQNIASQQMS